MLTRTIASLPAVQRGGVEVPTGTVASGCRSHAAWQRLRGQLGIARVDVTRKVAFGDLLKIRSGIQNPPSWTAMFVKAFAVAATRGPNYAARTWISPGHISTNLAKAPACIMHERSSWAISACLPCVSGGRRPSLKALVIPSAARPMRRSSFRPRALIGVATSVFIRRLVWIVCLNIPQLRRHSLGTYAVSPARCRPNSTHERIPAELWTRGSQRPRG